MFIQIKSKIKRHKKLKKIILDVFTFLLKLFMYLLNRLYGIDKKKVVFISFGGKSYSDNPKAISEKLYEMCPDFKIVWLFINPEGKKEVVPSYVKNIKCNTYSALKELATAKFWIDNFPKPVYTYKSKDQIYIQTFHGDRGFKRVLYDAWPDGKRPKPVIESKICDLVLSASNYADKVYRTAFHYYGETLKMGSPRNDVLINKNETLIENIKNSLSIGKWKKILLYAPTFRKVASKSKRRQIVNELDLISVIKKLEESTGYTWICLVRAHSAVRGLGGIPVDNIKLRDVTFYEDMADLLLIADILITDYSSSAGDFALLKRPIILYQSDRKQYMKDDRTFYFDIDNSPYTVVFNQEELNIAIQELDEKKAAEQCERILDFYGTFETGHASQSVVEYILSK